MLNDAEKSQPKLTKQQKDKLFIDAANGLLRDYVRAGGDPNDLLDGKKPKEIERTQAKAGKISKEFQEKVLAKIHNNLMAPPGINGNPKATFEISQLPSGEIIESKLKRSSGSSTLDDAISRALVKVGVLPRPSNPTDFVRSFEIEIGAFSE